MNPKAACVIVLNEDNKILSVSRRGEPTEFGLPGGKVNVGELNIEAAVRELAEETGLQLTTRDFVQVYAGDDGCGYFVTAFMCKSHMCSSRVRQMEEDMAVEWITPTQLVTGPFGQYNDRVLRVLLGLVHVPQ